VLRVLPRATGRLQAMTGKRRVGVKITNNYAIGIFFSFPCTTKRNFSG
jgi:hypothetical protein